MHNWHPSKLVLDSDLILDSSRFNFIGAGAVFQISAYTF